MGGKVGRKYIKAFVFSCFHVFSPFSAYFSPHDIIAEKGLLSNEKLNESLETRLGSTNTIQISSLVSLELQAALEEKENELEEQNTLQQELEADCLQTSECPIEQHCLLNTEHFPCNKRPVAVFS